jgi:hypothetical protein
MPKPRRKYTRPPGKRRYRNLFIIAAEGQTEIQYFNIFNNRQSVMHIECLKGKKDSSPDQVLKRMVKRLVEEKLRESDQAWLVVDKDEWTNDQLQQLYNWSIKSDKYGFALSNPKFEYWLLLHFEDGKGIESSRNCSDRLERYLPDYKKHIEVQKFTPEQISDSVSRAKRRDNPPCVDWPRVVGSTTVYWLVEEILMLEKDC